MNFISDKQQPMCTILSNGDEVTITTKETEAGEFVYESVDRIGEETQVTYRNVGEKNLNATIQFIIQKRKGKRTSLTTFNIPMVYKDLFIKQLSGGN